jgi:hypothetical protein
VLVLIKAPAGPFAQQQQAVGIVLEADVTDQKRDGLPKTRSVPRRC